VHPINTGPWLPTWHMLDFLAYDLGHDGNICYAGYEVAAFSEFFETQIIGVWEESSGQSVNMVTTDPGGDLTPVVAKLIDDGCEAVLAGFAELNYLSFFRVAEEQGLTDQMDVAMLTPGYSLSLLDSAGSSLEGVYVSSEFEPFTGDPSEHSDQVTDFLAMTEEVGVLPSSFGQAGYLSANIMITALESIEGEITFEALQDAIRDLEYETPMLGATFRATGYSGEAQPNTTTQILRVEGSDFVRISEGWRTFPLDRSGG
jgi:ABC-type branched-subunit amino acid transport system substrate-binding protein